MMNPTNAASTSTDTASLPEQNNGINIKDALSILSDRSKGGGDNLASNSESIPKELTEMGQTLNISDQMDFTKPDAFKCDCANENSTKEDARGVEEDKKHELMRQERIKRGEEINSTLQLLNVSELLGTIFAAQEERVSTYKHFDKELSTILSSRNITAYPTLCAKVTATFSVLSDTINAAKASLIEKHKRNDIGKTIAQLQNYEGEKLNLTAAIHLEKLRLNNSYFGLGFDGSGERSARLLRGGVDSLERKILACIDSINEMLEELRCIAAEEAEE